MRGAMIFFNEEKDMGFIRAEDGERVQVLRSGFMPGQAPVGRCSGLVVEFRVVEGKSEPQAVDVSVVQEAAPDRARRRRR